jgi:membrane-associated protein
VLSSMGVLKLPHVMMVAIAGSIIGDNVGYYLGHRLGRPWLDRYPRLIVVVAHVDELFARHGGKAVLVGRFVGFLRALAPFIAGASRMPYRTFVVYNAMGATTWAVAFVLLGYCLGESWTVAEKWIGRVGVVVGGLVIVAVVVLVRRRREQARATRDRPCSG